MAMAVHHCTTCHSAAAANHSHAPTHAVGAAAAAAHAAASTHHVLVGHLCNWLWCFYSGALSPSDLPTATHMRSASAAVHVVGWVTTRLQQPNLSLLLLSVAQAHAVDAAVHTWPWPGVAIYQLLFYNPWLWPPR